MIGKNRKGQGALEYLIIIAGVLAIAAIVVMFLTSGGTSSRAQALTENCRNAAVKCNQNLQLYGSDYDCTYECAKACSDSQKVDPATGEPQDIMQAGTYYDLTQTSELCDKNDGSACGYCAAGNSAAIKYMI